MCDDDITFALHQVAVYTREMNRACIKKKTHIHLHF